MITFVLFINADLFVSRVSMKRGKYTLYIFKARKQINPVEMPGLDPPVYAWQRTNR